MNANDQEKICKAGFIIIRSDDTTKPSIKCKKKIIQEVGKHLGMILGQRLKEIYI